MGQTPIRGPETPKTLPTTWLRDFENAAGQYELRKNVDFRESGIPVKNMLDSRCMAPLTLLPLRATGPA